MTLSAFPQNAGAQVHTQTMGEGFSIKKGEFIVISEMSLMPAWPAPKSAKKYYNFLVLHPRPLAGSSNNCCYFNNFTPFSPKPGLVTTYFPPYGDWNSSASK